MRACESRYCNLVATGVHSSYSSPVFQSAIVVGCLSLDQQGAVKLVVCDQQLQLPAMRMRAHGHTRVVAPNFLDSHNGGVGLSRVLR